MTPETTSPGGHYQPLLYPEVGCDVVLSVPLPEWMQRDGDCELEVGGEYEIRRVSGTGNEIQVYGYWRWLDVSHFKVFLLNCSFRSPEAAIKSFSMEPTYLPLLHLPAWMEQDSCGWHNVYATYSKAAIEYIKGSISSSPWHRRKEDRPARHPWVDHAVMDAECLEIPTGIYNDQALFSEHWNSMISLMRGCGMHPSSLIAPDAEGGCHINISYESFLEFDAGAKGDRSQAIKAASNKFFELIRNVYCTYPSLAWMFNSYNDDDSAKITVDANNKGYVVNNRAQYIELRAFMMPRCVEEMQLHLDFAFALCRWAFEKSQDASAVEMYRESGKNISRRIGRYTFDRALTEFNAFCEMIGFDAERTNEFGKADIMWQRFQLGKDYLV